MARQIYAVVVAAATDDDMTSEERPNPEVKRRTCEPLQTLPAAKIPRQSTLSLAHITNVFSSLGKIKGEVNIKCQEAKNGRKG